MCITILAQLSFGILVALVITDFQLTMYKRLTVIASSAPSTFRPCLTRLNVIFCSAFVGVVWDPEVAVVGWPRGLMQRRTAFAVDNVRVEATEQAAVGVRNARIVLLAAHTY